MHLLAQVHPIDAHYNKSTPNYALNIINALIQNYTWL